MRLCVYEDRNVAFLEPLTLCRPAFDLWCGSRTLLRRQRHYFGAAAPSLRVRPHLVEVCREAHPESAVGDWSVADPDAHVRVNARWMPPTGRLGEDGTARVGLMGEEVAYVVLPHDAPQVAGGLSAALEFWRHQLPKEPAGGSLFAYPW